jgi:hypothetical protein
MGGSAEHAFSGTRLPFATAPNLLSVFYEHFERTRTEHYRRTAHQELGGKAACDLALAVIRSNYRGRRAGGGRGTLVAGVNGRPL